MEARDVMTRNVIMVEPNTSVQEIANRLIDNRISAVPVVDKTGKLVGIVSEGDLMRRSETGTDRLASWWLFLLASPEETALKYVKAHGRRAADVMTRHVVTVEETTPIREVVEALEKHQIKRVPVMNGNDLVGIISRANLLRGLASLRGATTATTDDRSIKAAIEKSLRDAGVRQTLLDVIVSDGIVTIWGVVDTVEEKNAARVAAETAAGVKSVIDNLSIMSPRVRPFMWAE